jgi:microcystin-dependent protein
MSLAAKIAKVFTSSTQMDPQYGAAPAGVVLPFAGSSAPAGWLLCYGQAISRTTYAALFAALGTAYGVGDGSTTFDLPDMRGRVAGGKDDMGGSAASVLNVTLTGTKASTSNGIITGLSSTSALSVGMKALGTGVGSNAVISTIDSATQVTLSVNSTSTGSTSIRFGVVDGATLGDKSGAHVATLATTHIPSHAHTGTAASGGAHTHTSGLNLTGNQSVGAMKTTDTAQTGITNTAGIATDSQGAHSHSLTIDPAGGGQAHSIVQPTIILNYIIKA